MGHKIVNDAKALGQDTLLPCPGSPSFRSITSSSWTQWLLNSSAQHHSLGLCQPPPGGLETTGAFADETGGVGLLLQRKEGRWKLSPFSHLCPWARCKLTSPSLWGSQALQSANAGAHILLQLIHWSKTYSKKRIKEICVQFLKIQAGTAKCWDISPVEEGQALKVLAVVLSWALILASLLSTALFMTATPDGSIA